MTNKKKHDRRTRQTIELEREFIGTATDHGYPGVFEWRVPLEPTSRIFSLHKEGLYIHVCEGERYDDGGGVYDPETDDYVETGERWVPYTEVVGPYRQLREAVENDVDVRGVEEHATDHGWSIERLVGIGLRILGARAAKDVPPGGITDKGEIDPSERGFRYRLRRAMEKEPGQVSPPPVRTCRDLPVPTCQGAA